MSGSRAIGPAGHEIGASGYRGAPCIPVDGTGLACCSPVADVLLDDADDRADHRAAGPSDDATGDEPRFAWERWLGFAVVVACVLLVFGVSDADAHIWPLWHPHFGVLFRNTTTNGGDMGAHVWWPWFMEHHWFGKLRLAGWAPDWYAGFPVGQFYFPLPALLIAFLDIFVPYNIAFKWVTVLGPLLLPVAAYTFARGIRARWPMPPAFALAATVFLFNTRTNWQIYGGNLASNLAGEFSYTLAISLCLFFFAAFARTLDTGKRPWLPALLLALTALSHIVLVTFAIAGAAIIWLTRRPLRTAPVSGAVMVVGGLISGVWAVPLLLRQPYTQSMRYEKVTQYVNNLRQPGWIYALVLCAIIGAIVWRRMSTLIVASLVVVFMILFVLWPQDQHVWNTRYLPLYFLSVSLLAGAGAAEIANLFGWIAMRATDWVREGDLADTYDEAWASAGVAEPYPYGPPPGWEPPASLLRGPEAERRRQFVGALVLAVLVCGGAVWSIGGAFAARNYLPFWSKWNYEGYQSKAAWPEFSNIIETMNKLPPGRALWEPSSDIDKYGTTLALELLPYFTNGRIDSMEGLYFESSATTDYHFLTVSELTAAGAASNPVRGLNYGSIADFKLGVQHMQMLGVRYFMAQSSDAQSRADADPDLHLVAQVHDKDGQAPKLWKIYEVANSQLVEGLTRQPVVAKVHAGTTSSCFGSAKPAPPTHDPKLAPWECAAAPWWMNTSLLNIPFAQSGPKDWARVDIKQLASAGTNPVALPKVKVTDIRTNVDTIKFHVSRVGVPVVVKESYFPNWKVKGAGAIYRLAPNLMVVVPTSTDVTLTYGLTSVDWLGRFLTLLGLAGLVLLVRWRISPRRRAIDPLDGDATPAAPAPGTWSETAREGHDGAPALPSSVP